jgi:hypothetical protein
MISAMGERQMLPVHTVITVYGCCCVMMAPDGFRWAPVRKAPGELARAAIQPILR